MTKGMPSCYSGAHPAAHRDLPAVAPLQLDPDAVVDAVVDRYSPRSCADRPAGDVGVAQGQDAAQLCFHPGPCSFHLQRHAWLSMLGFPGLNRLWEDLHGSKLLEMAQQMYRKIQQPGAGHESAKPASCGRQWVSRRSTPGSRRPSKPLPGSGPGSPHSP